MTAIKVLRYELQDLRRSRWVFGYALLLLALTDSLLRFGGGGPRALLSLLNVVLVLVPLVSVVFGTMYLYGARDFIELLLAQPVRRGELFAGLYAGLALPLALAFVLGVGLPVRSGAAEATDRSAGRSRCCWVSASCSTLAFTALAFLISLLFDDRAQRLRRWRFCSGSPRRRCTTRRSSSWRWRGRRLSAGGPAARTHAAQSGRPGPGAASAPARQRGAARLYRRGVRAVLRERAGRCRVRRRRCSAGARFRSSSLARRRFRRKDF